MRSPTEPYPTIDFLIYQIPVSTPPFSLPLPPSPLCIALQLLHSKELHAAVVTKHGPTIMRGAVMLNPLTHLWMQVHINMCHSWALPLGMSLSAPHSGRA